MRGVPRCENGGWRKLFAKLLEGQMPSECNTCVQLFERSNFDMEAFQKVLEPANRSTMTEPKAAFVNVDDDDEVMEWFSDEELDQHLEECQISGDISVLDLVKADPNMLLLRPNTHKRLYPVECKLCYRKSAKQHSIFDLHTLTKCKYYHQHVNGVTHRANLRRWKCQQESQQARAEKDEKNAATGSGALSSHECQGLRVPNCGGKLETVVEEFIIWASYTSFGQGPLGEEAHAKVGKRHRYTHNIGKDEYVIVHHACEKEGALPSLEHDGRFICGKCLSLRNSRPIIRMIGRFSMKYMAARLLSFRLFQPQQIDEFVEKMMESPLKGLGFSQHINAMIDSPVLELQRYVRTQFMCLSPDKWGVALKDMIASIVTPCLVAHDIAQKMDSRSLNTIQDLNLKLGCAVAAGHLNEHPLVQGILVATVEMAKRRSHGVHSMRKLMLSELEMQCMAEAGVALAAAAANSHLVKQFGLAFAMPRVPLHNLHAYGLPEPYLALSEKQLLKTNWWMASNLLVSKQVKDGAPHPNMRRLSFAFDRTYILKGIDVVSLRRGRGFVGEAFNVENWLAGDSGSGFIMSEDTSFDATSITYANEICEFLVWDGSLSKLPRFPVCSIPTSYKIDAFQMAMVVGEVLEAGHHLVQTVIFDNATSHNVVKAFLTGKRVKLTQEKLEQIPFFNKITYEDFPSSALPVWPFRRPKIGKDTVPLGLSLWVHAGRAGC
eukprot:Skav215059  [mRNA]  locus=scaffold1021:348117:351063:- [translate_table: standard]